MDYILNLGAFFLPVLLFCYWGILGYALLTFTRPQEDTLQNLLLAPVMGYALLLLFIFWLNYVGLPIKYFATLLSVCLFIPSVAFLLWKKPTTPLKLYLPFVGIFLLALVLIASPFLKFGFDWMSYGNDDMSNYVLGALRCLNYGYFDVPNIKDLVQQRDYSVFFWFTHVVDMIRSGSEITLAWISAISKLNPLQVFMPTITAFHLMLVSTTGALVYSSRPYYRAALVTCILLSFSPLTALGTFYQLIGQVSGLSFLMLAFVLICYSFSTPQKYSVLKQSILLAITMSGLLFVYPEVIAFLGVSFVIYVVVSLSKGGYFNKSFLKTLLCAMSLTLIFINMYFFSILEFLFYQYTYVMKAPAMQVILFPYFLLPTGLANIWGFLSLTAVPREPFLSLAIISGALLLLFVAFASLRLILLRVSLAAIIAFVMMMVGINLFSKNQGFGLFKLAMFVQPFFISVIVLTLFELIKSQHKRNLLFLIFLLSGVSTFYFYLDRSKGITPDSFSEITYGSRTKITKEYQSLISTLPDDSLLLSDDFNISLIKVQALESYPHRFYALTSPNNFVMGIMPESSRLIPAVINHFFSGTQARILARLYNKNVFYEGHFNLYANQPTYTDFKENNICSSFKECNDHGILIADTSLRSVFNRRNPTLSSKTHNFALEKFSQVRNHLVFLDSSRGRIYHSVISNNLDNLTFFNLERDVIYPHDSMQAVGRYLLMKVFNPTPKVRFEIALTNTFDGNGSNKIPQLAVIGNERVNMPVMGRGSARVFSEPFSPQIINGWPYIATDMNVDGTSFPSHRKGIMRWYNKDLVLDLRKIATFARNISLISEEDYQKINPPIAIKDFPKDLNNPDLAYSGIYEDGWISENAFVELKQIETNKQLIIQGMLPQINPQFTDTNLLVLVDGKKIAEQNLQPGEFKLALPMTANSASKHKIELHFNKFQQLPTGDGRPVGAKIEYIGFA